MKKLFVLIAITVAFTGLALATPFIVSDPQVATKYRMRLSSDNGATWGAWVEGAPIGGAMKFDIAGTPVGNYKGEAQAGDNISVTDSTTGQTSTVFSWSASAPFLLNVKAGQKTINIKVIE
jgi:hypothetical protein